MVWQIRQRKCITCCKYAGSVNTTFIFSMVLITFDQIIAFRQRGVTAICANLSFCNDSNMFFYEFIPGGRGLGRRRHANTANGPARANTGQHGPTRANTGMGQHGPTRPSCLRRGFGPFCDTSLACQFGTPPYTVYIYIVPKHYMRGRWSRTGTHNKNLRVP